MAITPSSTSCCGPVSSPGHHTSVGVIAAIVVAILAAMIVALVAIVQAGSATIVPQPAPVSVPAAQPPTVIVIPNAQPYPTYLPYETDPDWEFELPETD